VDTAHSLAAGYELRTPRASIDGRRGRAKIGLSRLALSRERLEGRPRRDVGGTTASVEASWDSGVKIWPIRLRDLPFILSARATTASPDAANVGPSRRLAAGEISPPRASGRSAQPGWKRPTALALFTTWNNFIRLIITVVLARYGDEH
jgi:hypothetical protein